VRALAQNFLPCIARARARAAAPHTHLNPKKIADAPDAPVARVRVTATLYPQKRADSNELCIESIKADAKQRSRSYLAFPNESRTATGDSAASSASAADEAAPVRAVRCGEAGAGAVRAYARAWLIDSPSLPFPPARR